MSDLFSSFSTVQKMAERSSSGSGGNAGFLGYIYWPSKVDAGRRNEKIIRVLHDGCIVVKVHERVQFLTGKPGDVVCLQNTMVDNHGNCPLCSNELVATSRGYGLAVEREERIEGEGASRRPVVSDRMREIEGGESVPYLGTVKQALSNFWNNLAPISYRYGTVVDRDIQVTRSGSDTSTSYSFLPFDVDQNMDSADKVLKHYEDILQGRSPQEVILQRLNQQSSPKYLEKNLGITAGASVSPTPSAAPVAAPSSPGYGDAAGVQENSGTSFADLKSRLQGYKNDD